MTMSEQLELLTALIKAKADKLGKERAQAELAEEEARNG